jgi:hypothetical protein
MFPNIILAVKSGSMRYAEHEDTRVEVTYAYEGFVDLNGRSLGRRKRS